MTDEPDTELHFSALLTEDEQAVLDCYRGLNERGRQTIWNLLRVLYRVRQGVSDDRPA